MNNVERTIIFVSGIDPSLCGLEINGFTLKITHQIANPLDDDYIGGSKRAYHLASTFLGFPGTLSHGYSYVLREENNTESFMYFEKSAPESDVIDFFYETQHLINCMRLVCCSRVGFYCPLNVNSSGGCVAMSDIYHTFHSVYSFEASKISKDSDLSMLKRFYAETYSTTYNATVKKMLKIFHDSYRMHSQELKLIQRVTIMEMLVDGNAELMNRISRTVAVFLGRTLEEIRDIFSRMKNLYTARSKYLHDGCTDKIKADVMVDALELSRRIIANLMYIKCDMKEFRRTIDEAGFGTNPFDVKILYCN